MFLILLLSATIHGMVMDAETGNPLPGAAIVVEGKGAGTYADENGHFMLVNAPEPPIILIVNMVGYQTKRIELSEVPTHISVALIPSAVSSEEVEIISSPTLHDMSQSPIPTQKVDAVRLQSANQISFLDAVRVLPGITASGPQSSGALDAFSPRLQGLLSHHTLVLFDNKRLFCHDGTGSNISSVPLLLVERIEVIEGASCAIHGSDALGGIINIITKRPSPNPFRAFRTNIGTYGNLESEAAVGGAGPDGSAYILSLGQRSYEGLLDAEAYRRMSISAKTAYRGFALNGAYSEGETGQNNPEHFWNKIGELGFTWMGAFSHNELSAYLNNYYRNYGPSRTTSLTGEIKGESHLGLSYHNIMTGLVFRETSFGKEDQSAFNESFYGLYFEDDARPWNWFNIDLAGRLDRYPVGGFQLTPKAGFRLKPNRLLVVRAYVGRGFRAPSLQDRYEEDIPAGSYYRRGNPGLLPEASASYSAGADFAPAEFLSLGVAGFYNHVRNIIILAPTEDSLNDLPILTRENVPSAYTWGISLKTKLQRGPFWSDLSYTYLRARDDETELPLAYEPQHTVSGQLVLETRLTGASLTGEWVSGRFSAKNERLPDYVLVNLNLFAKPADGIQLNMGVQNILNEDIINYDEGGSSASGNAGRTFNGGISVRF
ncbi:MAG: TonB-dependent receptor [candidate division WOR-3 bacterium]